MAQIAGAGAIVIHDDRILLVQRGNHPAQGLWSIPGGHVERDESSAAAAVRETLEETGLHVRVVRYVGSVNRPASDLDEFVIDDFLCELVEPGEPVAADDALAACFVHLDDLSSLDLVPGLLDALMNWGLIGR